MKIVNRLSTICLFLLSMVLPMALQAQTTGNIVSNVQNAPFSVFHCTTALPILKWDATLSPPRFKCSAGSTTNLTIQEEGSDLAVESKLNFIGSTITCVDDAGNGRTNCTVTSAADGVGYDEILEDGSGLTKRAKLNFIGGAVTCVDNSGSTRTDCTFTDSTGYTTVQEEGSDLTARAKINFIGTSVTAADDAGNTRTNVTVTAYNTVKDEGSSLTQRDTVNFIGPNVACVDNSGSTRTDCTFSSEGGEGPPWNVTARHHAYAKFDNASATAITLGGDRVDVLLASTSTGTLSVTPTRKFVFSGNSTTTGTSSGKVFQSASANGYALWAYRPVMRFIVAQVDSAGTDANNNKFYAGMMNGNSASMSGNPLHAVAARTCTNGSSTVTNGGGGVAGSLFACWDKGTQTNVQCCRNTEVNSGGGGNSTQVCTDTGIAAPASNTAMELVLDFLDSSNPKCWVNGVATAVTGNLPGANQEMVQFSVGQRTTAATTDLEMILYTFDEWWD